MLPRKGVHSPHLSLLHQSVAKYINYEIEHAHTFILHISNNFNSSHFKELNYLGHLNKERIERIRANRIGFRTNYNQCIIPRFIRLEINAWEHTVFQTNKLLIYQFQLNFEVLPKYLKLYLNQIRITYVGSLTFIHNGNVAMVLAEFHFD